MKEATGELNMTVITIIMIGAVLAFFWVMWGQIKTKITNQWNETSNSKDPYASSYNYDTNKTYEYLDYTMSW